MRMVGGIVAAGHLLILALALADRATYQTIEPSLLGDVVDSPAWNVLFVAVPLEVALSRSAIWEARAFLLSFTVLLVWGGLNLTVGVTADRPVGLLGPSLALLLAALSLVCANHWQTRSEE